MLVVLDRLSPAERVAFVLHDMFVLKGDRIAEYSVIADPQRLARLELAVLPHEV